MERIQSTLSSVVAIGGQEEVYSVVGNDLHGCEEVPVETASSQTLVLPVEDTERFLNLEH